MGKIFWWIVFSLCVLVMIKAYVYMDKTKRNIRVTGYKGMSFGLGFEHIDTTRICKDTMQLASIEPEVKYYRCFGLHIGNIETFGDMKFVDEKFRQIAIPFSAENLEAMLQAVLSKYGRPLKYSDSKTLEKIDKRIPNENLDIEFAGGSVIVQIFNDESGFTIYQLIYVDMENNTGQQILEDV